MKDLVAYIVKGIVSNPDDVSVSEQISGSEVSLILSVNPSDMGVVIGRSGQTIKAIRKLLAVRAMADNIRVNLQIAEPEGSNTPAAEVDVEEEATSNPSDSSDTE